jgi:hypothetical protein
MFVFEKQAINIKAMQRGKFIVCNISMFERGT